MKLNQLQILGKVEIDQPIDRETEYSVYLERVQNEQGKFSGYKKTIQT
jgi:hypothetical protein